MSKGKDNLICDEMSEKIILATEKLVTEKGSDTITVRDILNELDITNRVFYNRFHNINEVLEAVYERIVLKIRESLNVKFDPEKDFFEQVMEILVNTLLLSYATKRKFNQFVFEHDSFRRANHDWWISEIKKLIEFGKKHNYIKDVDSDMLSYSVWCFCRGFNVDAVSRDLSISEAAKYFKCAFGVFFDGLRA